MVSPENPRPACEACGEQFRPWPCKHKDCQHRSWDGYLKPRIVATHCQDCHDEIRHNIVDGRSLLRMDRNKRAGL